MSVDAEHAVLWEPADLYRIPLWLLARPFAVLAPSSLGFRLATVTGALDHARSRDRRRIRELVARQLGETDPRRARRLVRRYFQARAKARFCEVWDLAGLDAVRVEGLEHLDAALAAGRGTILATGHFGHARMIKPILRLRGYRALVAGNHIAAAVPQRGDRHSRLGRLVRSRLLRLPSAAEQHRRWQQETGNDLAVGRDVGGLLAALEANETVVMLADGPTAEAPPLPLRIAGMEVAFAPRVVSAARRTGATVLPAFVVDDPGVAGARTLRLVIHPPLALQATDDGQADDDGSLRRLAQVWEAQLRSHPHDWLWEAVEGDRFVAFGRHGRRAPAFAPKTVELRDLARIPLWLLAKPVYAFAPPSAHFRLASAAGALDWRRSPHRRALEELLARHLDETEPRRLRRVARHHFEARAKARFCEVWPHVRGFAGIEEVRIDGLEHLDAALAAGRGAILASAHFGYGRMIKPILAARGYRPLVCGDGTPGGAPEPRTRLGRLVHDRVLRLPAGSQLDPRWQRIAGNDLPVGLNVRPLVAALRRNEALVLLADGRTAQSLRSLPVGAIEVSFAPGVAALARETGAALLPAFVVDDPEVTGPGTMRLVIHPPLEVQATDDREADVDATLRAFARAWELQLQSHPHDWLWNWVRGGRLERSAGTGRRARGAATAGRAR